MGLAKLLTQVLGSIESVLVYADCPARLLTADALPILHGSCKAADAGSVVDTAGGAPETAPGSFLAADLLEPTAQLRRPRRGIVE